MAERYRHADLFVSPSVCEELFGMSNAEAMACGLPVVSTRMGGIPEVVVDGKTGVLVPPNDSTALGEAILRLLKDGITRRRMGEAARLRAVELFPWDKIAGSLLSEYEQQCGTVHDASLEAVGN